MIDRGVARCIRWVSGLRRVSDRSWRIARSCWVACWSMWVANWSRWISCSRRVGHSRRKTWGRLVARRVWICGLLGIRVA